MTQTYDIYTGYGDGNIIFERESDNANYNTGLNSASFYDGNWTFVAAVSENGDLKMYVGKTAKYHQRPGV